MDLAAGYCVTPHVRLVRQLGAGGMGAVWLADHATLRSQVVVKFLAPALSTDVSMLERFSREAALASQLRSPHVVQVLDHGVTEGRPFILMELLEGEDLETRLARERIMRPLDVVTIVRQTCKALSRAHAKGIAHRDIKPANIFLCHAEGEPIFVKLLDFGIAKAEGSVFRTETGTIVGSPYYMSPEQSVAAKDIDHRTDLWSLGVVVFEALTGRVPFEGASVGAIAVAINGTTRPVPSTLNPALPKTFDAWFARACAREPANRFSTAKEMASSLAEAFGIPLDPDESAPGVPIGVTGPASAAAPAAVPHARTEIMKPAAAPVSRMRMLPVAAFAVAAAIGAVLIVVSIVRGRSHDRTSATTSAVASSTATVASAQTQTQTQTATEASASATVAVPPASQTTSAGATKIPAATKGGGAATRPPTTVKPHGTNERPLF